MTEPNISDEDLTIVDDEAPAIADEDLDAVPPGQPDPDLTAEPADYPEAAENNPDRWREDPLIEGEDAPLGSAEETASPAFGDSFPVPGEEGEQSDQTLRDESAEERYRRGDEQIPPEEPMLGEAVNDVDFSGALDGDEADGSDDPAHLGGDALAEYGDPDRDH